MTTGKSWEPFPHQVDGAAWLEDHPRSILADPMGVGKGIQVGMLLSKLMDENRVTRFLVIGKSILGYNWQDELREKFGIGAFDVAVGTDANDWAKLLWSDRVFTNYAKLQVPRFQHAILSRKWDMVVVDEAHRLRGRRRKVPDTDKDSQANGLWKLAKHVERIHFLTGSPTPNRSPAEMWSWLHAIDPKTFRSYWDWVGLTCVTEKTEYGIKIGRAKHPEMLATFLTDYLLRRDFETTLPDGSTISTLMNIPPLMPTTKIRHRLSPRQSRMYRQMKRELIITLESDDWRKSRDVEAPNTAARWTHLRRVCLSPRLYGETESGGKLDALDAILEELLDEGRQVVIYTWHRDFAYLVAQHVSDRHGAESGTIVGDMSTEEQYAQVRRFIDGDVAVIVGTIAAMGEGINLHAASAVIFLELSYVSEDNTQAVKRVHRLGAKRPINVYVLIADGTLEEQIYETVVEKREDVAIFHAALVEAGRKEKVTA